MCLLHSYLFHFVNAKIHPPCANIRHIITFNEKMIKLAIFDLDGTLLDTLGDIAGACNHALAACGCPMHETDKYRTFVGRGIMNLFRSALPEGQRTEDMVMRMKDNFVPYYDEHKNDLTRPYPGILELLDGLTAKGIRLAVASFTSSDRKIMRSFSRREKISKLRSPRLVCSTT